MKIYFAGTTGIESREKMVNDAVKHRLISFYYIDKGFAVKYGFDYIINLKKKAKKDDSVLRRSSRRR